MGPTLPPDSVSLVILTLETSSAGRSSQNFYGTNSLGLRLEAAPCSLGVLVPPKDPGRSETTRSSVCTRVGPGRDSDLPVGVLGKIYL